ncbi:YusW family protein [Alkaliphilus sp. MSJ-5]|uniref:YusW family protein n=1 Tax=Alkaliphilus flagellatus TaxID=2841507 RepID=A0ABS6G2G5_9FIRM|nr:YusW family protein [Alkaliphilus flagellatus]MBU5675571.1 YusW family protein [Alkaliphilus flagellatus]
MKIKKVPFLLLILLLFSLTTTGCNTAQRPNISDPNKRPEPMQNNTNTTQPKVDNDATVNDKRTKDNIMPDQPQPVTPTSEVGFTLNQLNEFELNVELANNDKLDMKYKKGPYNQETKVKTIFDGKTEKANHEEASRQIEKLLSQIPGASISNPNKIIDGTLSALKIKREDVVEFDMEFVFETGERVHIEFNEE